MTNTGKAAYILAGGRSTRMRTDKARLLIQGRTLARHIAEQASLAADNVTLVGGEPLEDLRTIPDRYPGFGPVGGMATALLDTASEWNLLLACDMPFVTAPFLAALLARGAEGGWNAVIPQTPDGRRHPLCAAYRLSALGALQLAVATGVHTVREAIKPLYIVHFPVEDLRVVTNINTPDEWATALAGEE